MMDMNFGYWTKSVEVRMASTRIAPLPDHEKIVDAVRKRSRIAGGWFYPPLIRANASYATDTEEAPYIHAEVYALPSTHTVSIEKSSDEKDYAEFVIALVGMLQGVRFLPDGWVHFYRTPVSSGQLTDLNCDKDEIAYVLESADRFWDGAASRETRRLLFGAVHWLLFGQSYTHEFERFGSLYTVLDSCFRIHRDITGTDRQQIAHARRPAFLAERYSIPEPSWALVRKENGRDVCDLSKLRNEFIHEARYAGEPIGFAHATINPPITLQLAGFCTRLILGILGVDCDYVATPVDTRAMHCLDITQPS